jgi:hypothetical protein
MKRFVVDTDADGLDIDFAHTDPVVQNPLINGIEVVAPDRLRIVEAAGSAPENGAALRSGLSDVATANAGPDNHWMVKLLPGTYDVGDAPLTLLPYVELEGSGEAATTITRTSLTPGTASQDDGVVRGVDHSTLRHLTVSRPPGGSERLSSRGIVNDGGAPRIESVTVDVRGHTVAAIVANHHVGAKLLDVTLRCEGGPAWSTCLRQENGGTLRASNLTMTGSVVAPGDLTGLGCVYSSAVVSNAAMELSGPGVTAVSVGKGAVRLYRSTLTIDGGHRGTKGLAAYMGGLHLGDVTLEITGFGAPTTGISVDLGSATLERTTIQISAGDSPTGLRIANSSLAMTGSDITAREDVYDTGWGIDLGEGRDVAVIADSSITAPSSTVQTIGMAADISNSTLAGGPVIGNGSVTCTNVTDEHGTSYPDTCPG